MQDAALRRSVTVTATVLAMLAAGVAFGQPTVDANRCTTAGALVAECLEGAAAPESPPPHLGRPLEPVLLGSYPDWDYWNLDTSGVRDAAGNLQFAVRLWEYSNHNQNFDRYVFNPAGELIETWPNWIGVGGYAVATAASQHSFLKPSATTQNFGVADSLNYIHVFYTSAQSTGWEIAYTKLDPNGNTVIAPAVLTSGANCWNWYLQPVVTSDDAVVVVWFRDTEDICAIRSDHHGVTWSDITVLIDRQPLQGSCLKAVVGSDDSFHLVWRTLNWTTYIEQLWYAKLRPDWSIAVNETVFFVDPCWYPFASLDDRDSVHVTFTATYDIATELYYTRLRGDLDLGGAAATDALLTLIPEQVKLIDPDNIHYPLNLADAFGAVHVVYEAGAYGCRTDKDLYYVRLCALVGDLDCDEDVDLSDLATLLAAYGTCAGEPRYEILADLDGDGCVGLSDLGALLANYGAGV